MQVTDKLIEKAARAMCIQGGYDPDERMPNNGPRWRYYVGGACAALTALSDKQAGEVNIKPLEWPNDSDWNIATSELGRYVVRPCLATNFSGQWLLRRAGAEDSDKTLYPSEDAAKAAAQADYEQRIRSALVDVPAVEPVAWEVSFTVGSTLTRAVFGIRDGADEYADRYSKYSPAIKPLYSSPPLSREGEDSAEVAAKARTLATAILQHFAAMEDGDGNEAPELAMARDLLAATRSGSATGQKGCAE